MKTNDDWTMLHCSVKSGSFKLFSYFLDKEVEIYCRTKNMENILHLSSQDGHFDICEFVLKYFIKDYKKNNSKKHMYYMVNLTGIKYSINMIQSFYMLRMIREIHIYI